MKNVYLLIAAFLLQATLFSQNPILQWAKTMGQTSSLIPNDTGHKIIPLSNGDLYFVGRFGGTVDFDPGAGVANLTAGGVFDIVIAKYTSNGNLLWAKRMGGSNNGSNNGHSISPDDAIVDNAGNLYITGSYDGTIDMDPSAAQYLILPPPGGAGLSRVFVGKYNTNGDFLWAFGYGANDVSNNPSYNVGKGLALDNAGDLVVVGKFHRTCDFDPGAGDFSLTSIGTYEDIFFAKYTTAGNFIWAKKVGGGGIQDTPTDIIADAENNIYISGYIAIEADFDPGSGTAMVSSNDGGGDIFLAKYDANGNYQWAFSAGSSVFYDVPGALGFDNTGNIMMTGYFTGTVDFDPGAGTSTLTSVTTSATIPDIFMAKYTTGGNLLWAKSLAGAGYKSSGTTILIDQFSRIFIAGSFTSTMDFDPSAAVAMLNAGPTATATYIAQYDNNGNYLNAAALVGPNSYFNSWGLFVDQAENIYFTGGFEQQADFDPGAGVYNLTASGSLQDIFMAKYKTGTASLSGVAWNDINTNGVQDSGEPGIGGISMQMTYDANNNTIIEPGEGAIMTATANNGAYAFATMPQGNFIVSAVPPSGYSNTTPTLADGDLTEGQIMTGSNFGFNSNTCTSPVITSVTKTSNSVTLNYTVQPDAITHQVRYRCLVGGVWTAWTTVLSAGSPHTVSGLGCKTKCQFMVRTRCSNNAWTAWSAKVTVKTDPCAGLYAETEDFGNEIAPTYDLYETINLLPNPAIDKVTVRLDNPLEEGQLLLINLSGGVLYNTKLTGVTSYDIDLTDLPAGVYIVMIRSGEISLQQQLIKQ